MFCDMNYFEELLEKDRLRKLDSQYFSGAKNAGGSQYCDDFESISGIVGSGGFGIIKLSKPKKKNQQVLKVVTKMIAKENILPWQRKGGQLLEAEILMNITHINVVSCLDLYQNTEYIHIVMEYCPGKTLFDLVEHISKIPENLARILFKQVVSAVSYLHMNCIVHGDIKDENILVDENQIVKLIDFGSAQYDDGKKTCQYCGSETYSSPEVASGGRFLRVPQEVWSLGVLLFVMVTGSNPFSNILEALEGNLIFPRDTSLSEGVVSLVRSMMLKDVIKRSSLNELSKHFWMEC